jgi:peptidoglycan/xylan/chitin deacetylase (PgdA/CDA1 family)
MLGLSNMAPYDFWLEEEGQRGFHSTFFVLPEHLQQPTAHDHYYRYADAVRCAGEAMTFAEATRRIAQQGWEIGLHGSYASALDEEILRREKAALEAMLEQPVASVRQHFLRFNIDVTPRAQAGAGFTADSTLGYSQTIGCRAGIAFPFYWAEAPELLEAPLIIHDVGLLRNSRERGHLDQALARARALIEQTAEVGGVATLSWHTHPESTGAQAVYQALLQTIAELDGWGCSLEELNVWWRNRRELLRESGVIGCNPRGPQVSGQDISVTRAA